ncbi:MarR family transcriptional regulator [Ktedonosporobacter rubrisoli]|uniref:MarR family transcriptional regulator n=1 Tax=Ktedonosporobacter rubrisoli TaxID=2509675 RepID=A0A4P6JNW1_KTERU|nr:MarR family transcriptional regulator [Ktedonosporobacter rubrisoli]QBD77019.1 MarR family transcriptional regulator [Ktedonosporobacter rubrisoli]
MDEFSYEMPEQSLGFLLWQVTNLWQKYQRAALEPLGLTHVQFVLLASINRLNQQGTPVTQIQLARHAHTDVMMTSEVVRTLEKKRLIQRAPHPVDTRAKCLSITPQGLEKVKQAIQIVAEVDHNFFASIPEGSEHFAALLRHLLAER